MIVGRKIVLYVVGDHSDNVRTFNEKLELILLAVNTIL